MAENSTQPGVKPAILPKMKWDEIRDRAQRIADLRGFPPYTAISFVGSGSYHTVELSADEIAIINDFMTYWKPYLVLKEKPVGS